MKCEDVRESLSAFQDDELDPVTSRQIERHLDDCLGCADMLGGMKELSRRLHADMPYYRAPDPLRARVSEAAWKSASRGRAEGGRDGAGWARSWLGAAAALVVAIAGTWFAATSIPGRGAGSVERDVVSSHIRSLMASHLTDIASTDQHTVKPWFNGKLDFSPTVTDLASSGYPLIGGRLDYLDGRQVAALVYQRRKHWINVFTWPTESDRNSVASSKTRQGFHVIHATIGGMAYWIVSDLNAGELSDFARLLLAGGGTPR
jgi:anti-sigma factor RsiW